MRGIDIFVSSPEDVRKERTLVERSIRSIAAEFDVPVTVTYSNWRKSDRPEDRIPVQGKNGSEDGRSWLFPCFWEYQDSNLDKEYREQIPNTGSYDLVVSILWSRLGTRISSACVMPDGGQPQSANEYEVAWVLDQLKRTPGFPELRIYRNQSAPPAPLQPRDERDSFFKEWDAVQEFFNAWERKAPFAEACSLYSDLQEFENLFREHFRDFLSRQLQKEVVTRKTPSGSPNWISVPYRGLQSFEFEQAPIFFGRTKAVGEVLEALSRQSNAQKPFLLVIGPAGSGKNSLVRAGVLPLLTEVGNSAGEGPWRRAMTRPGSGITGQDPIDALAIALLSEDALPELQPGGPRDAGARLASELREQPDLVASRAKDLLDQISRNEMDHLLRQGDDQSLIPGRIEFAELSRHRKLRRAKPQAQLALVIGHLEDLFSAGFSHETQRQYVAAIASLVRTQRIAAIATLQSEFYKSYQQLSELVALSSPGGRFDLQPPTRLELAEMIRFPAKATGLRFERDRKTGQGLDEILANAAAERTDSLPLLEYVLLLLYQKQLDRKDGLLRFSDYREIGEFDGALARRAESAFAALTGDAQHSFDFVFRRLVALGPDGKTVSRPALYKNLISSPEHNDRRNSGAKELVESMLKEGLFTAENESRKVVIVRIADHVLLSKWPRIEQWLIEDQGFVRMRDRVDGCMRLWQKRGRRAHDLLSTSLSLSDGETLINHFHSSLSDGQIEYIQKSLNEQKRLGRRKLLTGLVVLIALASLAAVTGFHWFKKEGARAIRQEYAKLEQKIIEIAHAEHGLDKNESKQLEDKARLAQQRADAALKESASLEIQLKKAQEQLQTNKEDADRASTERTALATRLKQAEEKVQDAQKAAELAGTRRDAAEVELKKTQDESQTAQQNEGLAAKQRDDLEAQLKQLQDKAQLAQQNAELASSQRADLQSQLKLAQDQLAQVQQSADQASSQRADLQSQLKLAQDKLAQVQQSADQASSQRAELQSQLKLAQEKFAQAQQSADQASSQRADLQSQLKLAQEKFAQAQQNADQASSQRTDLQSQLKLAQEKFAQAQQSADQASSQRADLQSQLKLAQDKLAQAQQSAEQASSQRAELQSQLKLAQDKLAQAQQSAEQASSQRAELQAQLKQAQDKLQQAQQNAELASSQRASLQAQLRKAEEKAQLAQKIADLVAGQSDDGGSATPEAYRPKPDSAPSQNRSGRALPLDAGQNSTQPLIPPVQSVNH